MDHNRAIKRDRVMNRGFGTGASAGAAAALVLFAYRFATGTPTPVEALAERMVRLLPYEAFALLLANLQHLAKPLGFGAAIVTSLIGFGAGGMLYARAAGESRWPRGSATRRRTARGTTRSVSYARSAIR